MKKEIFNKVVGLFIRTKNNIDGMTGYDWGARMNVDKLRKAFEESTTCPHCQGSIIEEDGTTNKIQELSLYD